MTEANFASSETLRQCYDALGTYYMESEAYFHGDQYESLPDVDAVGCTLAAMVAEDSEEATQLAVRAITALTELIARKGTWPDAEVESEATVAHLWYGTTEGVVEMNLHD